MSNLRSPASMPPPPGIPPRYRIIHLLGQTPWTQTWLALDTEAPARPRCVIRQWGLGNSRDVSVDPVRQALLQEVMTSKQFEFHPQIPQMRDCFEVEQWVYLIRDYIPGHWLSPARPPQRWSELEGLRVLRAALMVLAIAHQRGIVHGNLHPHNLILHSTDSRVVLTDFRGPCLMPGRSSTHGFFSGEALSVERLSYIAPEQAQGQPCAASDLYALGRIIAERLTGLKLWQYPRPMALADLLQRSPKPLSSPLRDLLIRMTAPAMGDRLASATEALLALNADQPSELSPLSPFLPERSPPEAPAQWPELLTLLTLLLGGGYGGLRYAEALLPRTVPAPADAPAVAGPTPSDRLETRPVVSTAVEVIPPEAGPPEAPGSSQKQEIQARHALQNAFEQAEARKFEAALACLYEIDPTVSFYPLVQQKILDYQVEQRVRTEYLLFRADNRATVGDYIGAILLLKQIPPSNPAYGAVQEMILTYGAAQRSHLAQSPWADLGLTLLWPIPLEESPPHPRPQDQQEPPALPGGTVQTGSKFQHELRHIEVNQHP